jgi:hypothetical protein
LLKFGLLILVHSHSSFAYAILDSRSLCDRISSGSLFVQICYAFEFLKDERGAIWFLWGQEFNQLLFVISIFKRFCGKLFLIKMECLFLFLFFHLFDTDIFKNRSNNRLVFLWRSNLALSQGHHLLGNDVVDVNSDVLEHDMSDESVLRESFEELNLLGLIWMLIKFNLICLASSV